MKRVLIFAVVLTALATTAFADEYVSGYTRKDGTHVNGYYRSDKDSSYNNNYSVQGNQNPYTGESGTKSRTWNDHTPSYNNETYGNPGYTTTNSGGSSSGSSGHKSKGLYGY